MNRNYFKNIEFVGTEHNFEGLENRRLWRPCCCLRGTHTDTEIEPQAAPVQDSIALPPNKLINAELIFKKFEYTI